MESSVCFSADDVKVRRCKRVHFITPVRVIIDGDISVSGKLLDVSETGAAMLVGIKIPMDTNVSLEFTHVFEGRAVRVPAVIRTCRNYIYGVEFVPSMEPAEEQKLQALNAALIAMGSAARGSIIQRTRDRNVDCRL